MTKIDMDELRRLVARYRNAVIAVQAAIHDDSVSPEQLNALVSAEFKSHNAILTYVGKANV